MFNINIDEFLLKFVGQFKQIYSKPQIRDLSS